MRSKGAVSPARTYVGVRFAIYLVRSSCCVAVRSVGSCFAVRSVSFRRCMFCYAFRRYYYSFSMFRALRSVGAIKVAGFAVRAVDAFLLCVPSVQLQLYVFAVSTLLTNNVCHCLRGLRRYSHICSVFGVFGCFLLCSPSVLLPFQIFLCFPSVQIWLCLPSVHIVLCVPLVLLQFQCVPCVPSISCVSLAFRW